MAGDYYTIWDRDGREVIAYHWHPSTPRVPHPHLHVERGAVRWETLERSGLGLMHNALRPALSRAHLPTHQISLAEFVLTLITQFAVPPRRADWERLLRA